VKWCEAVQENALADAKAGEFIEDPEHCIFYGVQERRGRFVIPDVQAAWEILKLHLTTERCRACLSANQTELKIALKQAGLKLSDVNAIIEQCGTRLLSTIGIRVPGLKESALTGPGGGLGFGPSPTRLLFRRRKPPSMNNYSVTIVFTGYTSPNP
jgi:hypothetical protein